MKKLHIFLGAVLCLASSFAQTTILPYGSDWKYLDDGSDQGAVWRAVNFPDAGWSTGNAELGYGDGDEATLVSYGPREMKKYITTYFRRTLSINDPGSFSGLTLAIKRDDGAVVYVNGKEVFRSNMPTGTISFGTKASTIASDDGNSAKSVSLPASDFVNGNNTIAVEIHQARSNDPDMSFDLQLVAFDATLNIPPVANAGSDQVIILPDNSATLNGSGSSDGDGTITSYAWTKISGPSSGTISNPGSVSTAVNGLVEGTYTFRLTVTDNDGASSTDNVTITVRAAANIPPVANAGSNQTITLPTNSVTLNGSGSSDADGTISLYEWTQVSGPSTASITTPDNVSTTVTGLVVGTYTFRLEVTDNDDASVSDDVVITVNAAANNTEPNANAGPDKTITLPTNSVTLNGGGSSDADGTITGYAWSKISGPTTSTITNPNNASTTVTGLVAGTYTFRLTVTDDGGATDANDVLVTVNAAANNTEPNANAGSDKTLTLPTNSVTLDGSGSSDADGTITAYAWTKISGPSSYTITNPNNVSTTVTGLVAGTYTFRLTVTDNGGATDANDVLVTVNAAANNTPPNANAGPDQTITLPTNSVTLNGSSSSDADGTITGYAWTKISGPSSSTINTPNNVSTTVTGLVAGTYTFRLTVTDNDGATDTNDMLVTVNAATVNTPPNANAGSNQAITLPTNSVTLNGNGSSDADGTITSYAWTKISGPSSYTINSPSNVSTTVTGLVAGTYTFRLTVTDNDGATDTDDMVVTVNAATVNTPPNANAGPDQTITLPTNSVTLNGSGSSDADGTITSYAWTKISGPSTFTITSPNNVSTTVTGLVAGTYTFRLTVTDNDGATDTDDMLVTVNAATVNTPPNANAGPDQTITLPTNSVTLNGSGSSDADGTITGYAWSKISGPSTFTITNPGNVSTTVTGLVAGTYTFRLTVTDNDGATDTNDMLVTVNAATTNAPPNANAGSDQDISLPTNSVTLNGSGSSDGDGTITGYAWSKISGPSTFTITSPNNVSTTVTGLVAGTYTFRLTITDNDGATDVDDVIINVTSSTTIITLTRGPYLQMANGSAVTLRWRTDVASNSKISVGTSLGTYTASATNSTSTTEHEVRITGLSADTKYYYSFGSSTETLQAGSTNFFTTAPPASTTRKIRVAAFGDCGRNQSGFQTGSLNSYQAYVGSNPAELMLLLGDNAYDDGTDAEYTSNFFNPYGSTILKNHVIFPTPGNHDYHTTSQADRTAPYYTNFTVPTNGECGGAASGTEAFYSYNWGNIHFLSLDSYGYESGSTRMYDTLGPQVTWVKKDLAANTSKWTIVYWHHPPYTMGSHNSDSESELVKIRQNFIRILERYGVDMVLCGHSHDYERSYLLKGYFGNEASFDVSTSAVNSSSGFYDGSSNSCAYNLKSGQVNHGTVYVVSGSSGADGSVQSGYPHNALPFAQDDGGMFYFEVENNRLDAKFIRKDGVIADKFTILKDAGKTSNVSISSGQSVTLTASWKGNYKWSTGATTQSITVSPTSTTSYTCTDGNNNCITDNFTVNVGQSITQLQLAPDKQNSSFSTYPTPVKRGNNLTISSSDVSVLKVMIVNDKGQKVKQLTMQGSTRVSTADMRAGIYYLRTEIKGKRMVRKIMVLDE